MSMQDWIDKLHGFLSLNDREILIHAGEISHELALQKAETQYDIFHKQRIRESDARDDDFENAIRDIT